MDFVKNLKYLSLIAWICLVVPVYAGSIDYGYNAHGDYKPTSIGNGRIQYGYNAHGNYVPTSVGGNKIQYGYNAHGDYVPQRINSY